MKVLVCLMVSLLAAAGILATDVSLYPLNSGELMLDSNFRFWHGKALTANTFLKVHGHMALSAKRGLKKPAAGEIYRKFKDFDCGGYDRLLLFLRPQSICSFQLLAETDTGIKKSPIVRAKNRIHAIEMSCDLAGAKKIKKITIRITADKAGAGYWPADLYFLALQDNVGVAKHLKKLKNFKRLDLDQYLAPASQKYTFKPALHIIFGRNEIEKFRDFMLNDPILKKRVEITAKTLRELNPQDNYDVSVPCGYTMREYSKKAKVKALAIYGASAACCGLILKDKTLLRKAAECALVLSDYESWNESPWTDKAGYYAPAVFRDSDTAAAVATILDLAGEAFSNPGRSKVLKAMAKKGFGNITYSLWARPCYHMNQGVMFLKGKLACLLAFEQYWQTVTPYTDAAIEELAMSMNNIFYPDGGYAESTGYFGFAVICAIPPYLFCSNARNIPLSKLMPQNIKKSPAFGHLIYSTSKNPRRQVVALGQSSSLMLPPETALFMSGACPGSIWERFVPKQIIPDSEKKKFPYGNVINLWQLKQKLKISGRYPELDAFTDLNSIGCVNSFRKTSNGGMSKILFMGYAEMGKREEDVGHFVIEYNGDAFADTLTARRAFYYGGCEWRNMLVPTGTKSIAHPIKYTTLKRHKKKFIPAANGDRKKFKAAIGNLADSWNKQYFEKWSRTIDSPDPEHITVSDDYKLGSGATGVDFIWITSLPAEVKDNKIIITGDCGSKCKLSWNIPCKASVETFTPNKAVYDGMFIDPKRKFSRIRIHRDGKQGKIEVKAVFIPGKK